MTAKTPGPFSIVVVPAILTLIVCIVRLVGELQNWNPDLFGTEAGGTTAEEKPTLFGIAMLVPIFGLWFGLRLRRQTGQPTSLARAWLVPLVGIGIVVGAAYALVMADMIVIPTKEQPGEPAGLEYLLGLAGVVVLAMFLAWPRLATTLLLYGLLARIPVVVITVIAINAGDEWNTHYTKLAAGFVVAEDEKLLALLTPQLTMWIAFTIFVGGLFGALGATLTRQKTD